MKTKKKASAVGWKMTFEHFYLTGNTVWYIKKYLAFLLHILDHFTLLLKWGVGNGKTRQNAKCIYDQNFNNLLSSLTTNRVEWQSNTSFWGLISTTVLMLGVASDSKISRLGLLQVTMSHKASKTEQIFYSLCFI